MSKLLTVLALSLLLFAAACGGEESSDEGVLDPSGGAADASPSDADVSDGPSGDGVDDCGQGQAFPDDPDFREAICRPMMAMVRLIGTDVEIDPEWNSRVSMAILDYADREAAMAELAAVLAEIEAAG